MVSYSEKDWGNAKLQTSLCKSCANEKGFQTLQSETLSASVVPLVLTKRIVKNNSDRKAVYLQPC